LWRLLRAPLPLPFRARGRETEDGAMDSNEMTADDIVRHLELLGIDASASRAALAVLKPLHELLVAAKTAGLRFANARSIELWLRALAQADATMPAESLVTVCIRDSALNALACEVISADIMPDCAYCRSFSPHGSKICAWWRCRVAISKC
jgi:hypothetical protein